MSRRPAFSDMAFPLLTWSENREVAELEAERQALVERLARQRPRTQRRLELEAELRMLTKRQLRIHISLKGREIPGMHR
jgi:hypothetical protein